MHRRPGRVLLYFGMLLCLTVGMQQTLAQDASGASSAEPASFVIESRTTSLYLRGTVSSVAHESILRQRAAAWFTDRRLRFDLRPAAALPPGWSLVTELALRVAAESISATIRVSSSTVSVVGVAGVESAWRNQLQRLSSHLPTGMHIEERIIEVGSLLSHNEQCSHLLASALRGRSIEFPSDSAKVGTQSFALLEHVAQIVADCPQADIRIVGHTDTTGDEAANLALSKARAEAVASFLHDRGIGQDRTVAVGRGGTEPVATANTSRARRANRRIELSFVFSPLQD